MCGKPKPRTTGFRRERNSSAGFGSAPAVSWRRRRTPVRKNKFAGERREASYLWRGSTPWRKLRFRRRRVLLPWRQCGYDLCGRGRHPPYQWECRHHPCRRDSRCAGDEQYGRRRRFGSGFGILGEHRRLLSNRRRGGKQRTAAWQCLRGRPSQQLSHSAKRVNNPFLQQF